MVKVRKNLRQRAILIAPLFALICSALLMSCSQLTPASNDADLVKVFAGLSTLSPKGDGTFQLRWGTAKVNGQAVYKVYALELGAASGVTKLEEITEGKLFASPVATVSGLSWVSPLLTFKNSTCFAIRLTVGDVSDTNTNIKCTNHEKFEFPGLKSLEALEGGKFRLAWQAVPDTEVGYSVFTRSSAISYDFKAEPFLKTTEAFADTTAFPLSQKVCFVVRSKSKNSPPDENSKEICSTGPSVATPSITATPSSVTPVDTTAPIVAISVPTASKHTNTTSPFLVSGTCSDNGLAVSIAGAGVAIGATPTCANGAFSAAVTLAAGDGLKAITASQTDAAGNASSIATVSVTLDTVSPLVTDSSPAPGAAGKTGLIFAGACETGLLISFDGAGVLNAPQITSCTAGTYTALVLFTPGEGNKVVNVSQVDLAGNMSATLTRTVVRDNTLPTIAFSNVSPSVVSSTVTLAGTCETGLAVVLAGVTPTSTTCASGAFSQSVTVAAPDGAKTVTATQTDSAGNISTTATLNLTRDTVAPALAIASPVSGQVFVAASSSGNIISGTCESGLNVVLSGNVTGQTVACSANAFSFSNVVFTAGDGGKSITVTQTDLAGNITIRTAGVTLDTTKFATINSPNWTGHVNGLTYTFSGSCISSGYTYTATSTVGTVRSTSCTANILAINVRMTGDGTGLTSGSITVTGTKTSDSSQTSSTTNFTYSMPCPTGYVGVPGKWSGDVDVAGLGNVNASAGNADAGLDPTRDFCVMKYPAKAATSNSGGQSPWEEIYYGNKTFTMANVWPQARASGTPWVNIDRDQSIDRCKALNEAYGLCSGTGCYTSFSNTTQGFRLMSNTQWQVVARNMEATGANWTSGTVGTGFLWRGQSDGVVDTNTDLHSQTFAAASTKALSSPRFDSGNDYFGTGNNVTQNTTGTSGWQERRRFVLSSGASVWDMTGNVWQWVSDNNTTGTGASGELGVSSTLRAVSGIVWWDFNNAGLTSSDQKLFASFSGYTSSVNTGQVLGSSAGALHRAGSWNNTTNGGLFSASMYTSASYTANNVGFRCAYIPPPLTGPRDTGVPTVTIERVTSSGTAATNSAVTVASSGLWHVGFNVTDAENTGANANKLWIQVRRKIANTQTNADYPSLTDAVYREGYLPAFQLPNTYTGTAGFGLADETAWNLDPATLKYTRNDGKFINYLVTVIEPAGNKSSSVVGNGGTLSVQNTQSCPQGYVGVPGLNGAGGAWNDSALNAGLGNVNATAGNSNKGLDISSAFCVMKFPAKIQSANTTVAASFVGGKLEPIADGYKTFSQVSTAYADAAAFDTNIRYIPDSRAPGTPWVNINRDDSILACRSLQMAYLSSMPDTTTGTGFQLLSNTQWQMMARNAENQASNWSNNAVGSGVLSRGHSDNVISATEAINSWCFGCTAPSTGTLAAPNSNSDINAYFATGAASSYATWNTLGTSPAAGAEQRRISALSNGGTLHDVGGNVWQWVSDNNTTGAGTGGDMGVSAATRAGGTWWEHNNAGLTTSDKKLFGSFGGYTSSVNAGRIYSASNGAVLRGGHWGDQADGGLFTTSLSNSALGTGYGQGFRCAFVP